MASRAHAYIDAGSDNLVTAWIPLGCCPLPTGGPVSLEDSQRICRDRLEALRARTDRPEDRRASSHDLRWVAETLDTTTAAMRLSADVRYIAARSTPDHRWLQPWAGDDGY